MPLKLLHKQLCFSYTPQGDYEIKATLKNGDTVLACYDFKASLKASSDDAVTNNVEIVV